METFDYQDQFERVKKNVTKAFTKALDVQAAGTGLKMKATDVWIDDNQDPSDWQSQRDATRKDKTWGVPVYAAIEMRDRKTDKIISTAKRIKIATLPKSTDLGSFIVDGKHYQVQNQLRRKPGIYITEKKNNELKTEVNIAGRPFDIEFNPKTSEFRLIRGTADSTGVALYPILSRMGISDSMLTKAWGGDVLAANKAIKAKKAQQAVTKAAQYFEAGEYDSADAAAKVIKEYLEDSELRPEVTENTVGKAFKTVTPISLVMGSKELLSAVAGKRAPDDRQALEYKKALGLADLIGERMMKPSGELTPHLNEFRKKLHRKLNDRRNPPSTVKQLLTASQFTPAITSFFTRSSLSSTTDQTNPLHMLNGMSKITILGDGGVADPMKVRAEERAVHPSQLGFLDPLHTPESDKIGVVMNLPVGIGKSGDSLKTMVYDVKAKKRRYITPAEARKLVIAFPDQWKDGKFIDKKVKVISRGEHDMVSTKDVDVVIPTAKQAFSISTNTIPFLNSSAGARAQMATKMSEQALPLTHREAPLVQSKVGRGTIEGALGSGFSMRAKEDGVVTKVTKNRIIIKTKDGEVEQPLVNNMALNNKSFLHAEPTVKEGDEVKAGQTIMDSNFTRAGTLALGTNLKAAYLPWKGYNFEDGIVITESAAKKLTSEHMNQFSIKPDKATELSVDEFVAWKPNTLTVEQQDTLSKDGVVKKGTILRKGDPIWVGVRENKNDPDYIAMRKLGANFKAKRGYMESWEKDVDGQVVDVVKTGKGLKVYVKSLEPAVVGDKLSNRHGGKGIITKIIPDGESPHTEDGEPVQILLNPHGIVGRINPSQVLETAAAKIAAKDGKPFVVDNFSGADNARELIAALKKAKIEDTELLFDPHQKEPLGKILVGPQYILKLSKQATSQFSARSEGKYDLNRSPLRGGVDGGKAVDLITFYSMLAHGSRANLREMATFKATKNQPFWDWLSAGSRSGLLKPPPEPTFAYRKFESYLKGAGVNVARKGSKMVLGPMTDNETGKLSNGEIKEPVFFRGKNMKEEKGGLFDPVVTGGRQGENWSHIQLAEPMPNPIFEDPIKKLTGLNNKQYLGLVRGELFVDKKTGEFVEEGETGGSAIKTLLKKVDLDAEIQVWTEKAKKAKGTKPLDEANKRLKYLHALKKLKVRPEDAYVQTKIPIIPPQFRQIAELDDGTLANPGLNTLYRDVGLVNNELKWQNTQKFMPDSVKAELRQNLYESVRAVSGQGGPISYYPEARRPKGIIEQIKGPPAKMGFYQYEVLRRRQNLVGRGTIIPEPKLAIDEVGLPQEMSWKLFEKFVMRRLVNQSGMSPAEASEEVSKRSPVAESALRGEMADRPVLLNRAPSLHKFSIMAFKPRPVAGKAIQIPPMIVKGFNADFDGDTMTVHVPVLPDAVKEAEGMLPSNNLYNPGTGRIMIQPEHEAALGLWMMSKDPAAAKKLDDVLPPDLKKKYRGVELGKKQFNSLMEDLAEQHPRDYGKIVDKLKLIGDDYTYRSGFTVGLKDLVPKIPERDMIARAARAEVGKLPLDTVQGRAKATALMTKANDELTKSVNRRLKQEDNNFHKMVESGARGNMSQLKQIVSTPFMVDDHRGNPTPQPIMKSFSEGLQFSDYWNTLYGARSVVVDKQLQTSKPGAFNKDIMAAAVSNVIADGDCETTDGLMLKLKDSKGRSRRQDTEDRFLAKDVRVGNTTIAEAGSPVTSSLLNTLQDRGIDEIECRSPLTCKLPKGTCARCYGLNEDGNLPAIGDNIGAISGQAMSEPLTQMTMRTFHMGGISGTRGIVTGYEKIDKMLKMHEIKRGKATLAQKGGKIDKVEAAPGGGGRNVFIDGKQHFVETGLTDPKLTRVGRKVRKGDIISKGLVQPQELVDLKGMLDAQNYVAGQVQEAYESQGVPLKRRATETIMRSIGNTTKILDPGESDFIYGDVAPWTVVNSFNDKSLGKVSLPRSVGHILREDVPGAKKGIVIDEKLRNVLERSGKSSVEVGPKPIIHKPFLSGIQRVPLLRQDWMSQMGYRELAKALIQGATKVQESDLHGYSPVPAFAYGAEFGDAPAGASKTKGVY